MMLALGIGTLPTMLFVTIAFGKLGTKFRGYMLKTAAIIMIVMGANTMYKGISFLGHRSGYADIILNTNILHMNH
jgi:sulfite exporter TauE/SafE